MDNPPLRLEWRSPAELAENPRNWRRHPAAQLSALSDVIAEVGWAGACLYNERTGRLIDGHARRKVALEYGTPHIPVLVGDWDEAAEAKILATLDPLGAMATADAAALDALLRDVSTGSEAVQLMLGQLAADSDLYRTNEGGKPDDPAEHWQGMPEFEHEDQTADAAFIIRVFLKDADDLAAFGRLLGKDLAGRKFVWFSKQPLGTTYEAVDGPTS
jgi:hypothetical protein